MFVTIAHDLSTFLSAFSVTYTNKSWQCGQTSALYHLSAPLRECNEEQVQLQRCLIPKGVIKVNAVILPI